MCESDCRFRVNALTDERQGEWERERQQKLQSLPALIGTVMWLLMLINSIFPFKLIFYHSNGANCKGLLKYILSGDNLIEYKSRASKYLINYKIFLLLFIYQSHTTWNYTHVHILSLTYVRHTHKTASSAHHKNR